MKENPTTMNNELTVYDIGEPQQALQVAKVLQDFVKERQLTAKIQGKDYPLVEAWQFAGSQLGIIPVITEVKDLSKENEIKYQSTVELVRLTDGVKVGFGMAVCSNKEKLKRHLEEYAIAAMSQTRAISRAYRNLLGWLMKAAGFEATPEDEAEFLKDVPDEEEKDLLRQLVRSSTLDEEKRKEAFATIDGCRTYELYQKIQLRLESLQQEFDSIPNPNQGDIGRKVRKIAGSV